MYFKGLVPTLLAAAALAAPAIANDDPGRPEFARGAYAEARAAGRASGTGEGLSVACQAELVMGAYLQTGDRAVTALHAAIGDCANSIEAGTRTVEAFLTYAIAVGFEAKRLGSRSLGAASRRLMEETVETFPESGFARAALAGWHDSVSQQGFVVRSVLGASREKAREGFVAAMRLEPESFAVNYERLRFLAAGDKSERLEAARLAARMTSALKPADKYEELLRDRAAIIGASLDSTETAHAALRRTEPFVGVQRERKTKPIDPPFLSGFPKR